MRVAKPDKTDKPKDAQTDKLGEADDIIDAEIVEEAPESDPQAGSEQADQPAPNADADDAGAASDPEQVVLTSEALAGEAAGAATDTKDETEAESETEVEHRGETESEAESEGSAEAEGGAPADDASAADDTPQAEAADAADSLHHGGSDPAPETAAPARGGFAGLVLGGVVAAALGFGAASYLGSQGILFGGGSDAAIAALTGRIEAQQDQLARVQSDQAQIAEAAATQSSAGQSAVAESVARMAALSQRVDELGGKLQTLEGRLIETEKRPMSQGASSAAIEAYEREVEQLRALVSEQLAEAEQLKATSTRTAQATLAQAALTRVVSAVDSGVPYRGALTELASVTGVAIPAALSDHADDGVATSMALADGFPEYARLALADARKQEKGGVGGGHFSLFLKSQLGARSTKPKEGDDADAILSRAEAALREGRLAASLAELDALPETSQALMANWRALAETRLAALAAVDALAQTLTSN